MHLDRETQSPPLNGLFTLRGNGTGTGGGRGGCTSCRKTFFFLAGLAKGKFLYDFTENHLGNLLHNCFQLTRLGTIIDPIDKSEMFRKQQSLLDKRKQAQKDRAEIRKNGGIKNRKNR